MGPVRVVLWYNDTMTATNITKPNIPEQGPMLGHYEQAGEISIFKIRQLRRQVVQTASLISTGGRVTERPAPFWACDFQNRVVFWRPTSPTPPYVALTKDEFLFLVVHESSHLEWSGTWETPKDFHEGRFHRLVNACEDIRIERLALREFPGFGPIRDQTNEKMLDWHVHGEYDGGKKGPINGYCFMDQVWLNWMRFEANLKPAGHPDCIKFAKATWPDITRICNERSTERMAKRLEPFYRAMLGQGGQPLQPGETVDPDTGSPAMEPPKTDELPPTSQKNMEDGDEGGGQGAGSSSPSADGEEQDGDGQGSGQGEGEEQDGDQQGGDSGQDQGERQSGDGSGQATDGGDAKSGTSDASSSSAQGAGTSSESDPQFDPALDEPTHFPERAPVKGNENSKPGGRDAIHSQKEKEIKELMKRDAKSEKARAELQRAKNEEVDQEHAGRRTRENAEGVNEAVERMTAAGAEQVKSAPQRASWEDARNKMRPNINSLARRLQTTLRQNAMDDWEPGLKRGQLDPGIAWRSVAGDMAIYRDRTAVGDLDYVFGITVDISSSQRSRALPLLRSATLVVEALEKAEIPNFVVLWNTMIHPGKGIKVPLNRAKDAIGAIASPNGGTYEAPALLVAYDQFKMISDSRHKVLITMTDGDTNKVDESRAMIAELEAARVHTIGIGVAHPAPKHYPERHSVADAHELVPLLPKIINKNVRKG